MERESDIEKHKIFNEARKTSVMTYLVVFKEYRLQIMLFFISLVQVTG